MEGAIVYIFLAVEIAILAVFVLFYTKESKMICDALDSIGDTSDGWCYVPIVRWYKLSLLGDEYADRKMAVPGTKLLIHRAVVVAVCGVAFVGGLVLSNYVLLGVAALIYYVLIFEIVTMLNCFSGAYKIMLTIVYGIVFNPITIMPLLKQYIDMAQYELLRFQDDSGVVDDYQDMDEELE